MCLAVGGGAVERKILGLLIRVLSLLTSIEKINQKKILICTNLEDTFVHKHRLPKSSCSFISTECQMDSFSSSPSSGLGESSQISTEDLMDNVKTQLAQAYAQEFLETLRDKCFEKCITKPGSSLSGSEGSCISRCVDRYIEATGIVSRALFNAQR